MPALMGAGAIVLVAITLFIDHEYRLWTNTKLPYLRVNDPASAQAFLGTIVGSIITVFGVVFSVTIVAMTLAANQFGPRLIRTFMQDRGTQFVLGAFVSCFLYCLLTLRAIDGQESDVPQLSVNTASVFTILLLAVLVYFIHHISLSMQVMRILRDVGRKACDTVDSHFRKPDDIDGVESGSKSDNLWDQHPARQGVTLSNDGYVTFVDRQAIVELACEAGAVVRLNVRGGDFVFRDRVVAVCGFSNEVKKDFTTKVAQAIALGPMRTDLQDTEFAVNEIVEIALRALSPGVNDPFTAVSCIDYLGSVLSIAATREPPRRTFHDKNGCLRLIMDVTDHDGLVECCFNQIRQTGKAHPAVIIRLLETIHHLIEHYPDSAIRRPLLRQVVAIVNEVEEGQFSPMDHAAIRERQRAIRQTIRSGEHYRPSDWRC